jgi:hypothetical protein
LLKELQQKLPAGWSVWETIDDRIVFYHDDTYFVSWTNLEGIDKESYSPAVETSSVLPSFEALSYTWGVEDDCIEVDVVEEHDGSEDTCRTLLIRPNLDAALR